MEDVPTSTRGRQPEFVVDPWLPCRWFRAIDSQTVQRSTDGGSSWQTVFHDPATGAAGVPFTGTSLQVVAPDTVAISESGNGDAFLVSRDAGTTWQLRHGQGSEDIAGQPIVDAVVAPANPAVAYAEPLPSSGADAYTQAPFVTRDAGATWRKTSLPAGPFLSDTTSKDDPCNCIVVDPVDPGRSWLLVQAGQDQNELLTTSDFGGTWSMTAAPGGEVHELVAVSSKRHPSRLLAVGYGLTVPASPDTVTSQVTASHEQLVVSDDDGASWRAIPVGFVDGQAPSEELLAADPLNEDRMVMTRFRHRVDVSTDGGDTWSEVSTTPGGHAGLDAPAFHHVSYNPFDPGGLQPRMVLQAAHDGTFYLTFTTACSHSSASPSACPRGAAYDETWTRYAPPWLPLSSAGGGTRLTSGVTDKGPGAQAVDVEQGDMFVYEDVLEGSGGSAVGSAQRPVEAIIRLAPDRLSIDRVIGCGVSGAAVVASWCAVVRRRRLWRRIVRNEPKHDG